MRLTFKNNNNKSILLSTWNYNSLFYLSYIALALKLKAHEDIIWFTYRKNFPILLDNKLSPADYYVNDTGWGCMIRVCQMMMAETLKRCMKDSNFIVTNLNEKIISLYLDCHTTPEESPFSIQKICKLLYDEFKLKPGQWFKVSNVFLVIQQIHSKYKNIVIN